MVIILKQRDEEMLRQTQYKNYNDLDCWRLVKYFDMQYKNFEYFEQHDKIREGNITKNTNTMQRSNR